MAQNPARLRSLYRSLLRELPPRPILATPRSDIHASLRTTFASSPSSNSPASPAASSSSSTMSSPTSQTAQAAQLVAYLRSQRKYVDLVERYNPGMNMDDEERVRLSARRIGMNMPVEYKES